MPKSRSKAIAGCSVWILRMSFAAELAAISTIVGETYPDRCGAQ